MISPEREVAAAAMRRLSAPSAFDTEVFMDGKAQLAGHPVGRRLPDCEHAAAAVDRSVLDTQLHCRGRAAGGNPVRAGIAEDQLLCWTMNVYVFTNVKDVDRTIEVFGKTVKSASRTAS